jgi:trimeric autotransporter adhesin
VNKNFIGVLWIGFALVVFSLILLGGCNEATPSDDTTGKKMMSPAEVAAISVEEISTFTNTQIIALDSNFKYLTNEALAKLSGGFQSQIQAISDVEIITLTPAQVRLLGSTGVGGVTATSKLASLNSGAWKALVHDSSQVKAFTADEIPTLGNDKIIALESNFKYLTNAALAKLSGGFQSQIQAISTTEIITLAPEQVGIIAATNNNTGISSLNASSFASLSSAQIGILTVPQKSSLSPAQHASCGC